jgi:hypothetical protein
MIFISHHIVLIVVLVVIVFVCAAGSAVGEAWMDVRQKPKEEMFWCFRHGYFRKKHCLPLFPELGGTAKNSFVCPSCYYDAVFTIPNEKLKEK